MIDKIHGEYYVYCDACGAMIDEPFDDFQDALDGMKAEGWKTVDIGGVWCNYCPECAAKQMRPTANEFAGIHASDCTCGGRPVPADKQEETRRMIEAYRSKHNG